MDQKEAEQPFGEDQDLQIKITDLPDYAGAPANGKHEHFVARLWRQRRLRLVALLLLGSLCLALILDSSPGIRLSLLSRLFG